MTDRYSVFCCILWSGKSDRAQQSIWLPKK